MRQRDKAIYKKRILLKLIESDKPLTTEILAEAVQVSPKSIRNYLKEIESEFTSEKLVLVKKPRVGVYIDKKHSNMDVLTRAVEGVRLGTMRSDAESRRHYILQTLFNNKTTYTLQLFADELYCSKTTIANDLVIVDEWLKDRGLTLNKKQGQGIWIEGLESDIRKSMMDMYFEAESVVNEKQGALETDYRMSPVNYRKIMSLFPKVDLVSVQKIVQDAEVELGYTFTDGGFTNLIAHLAIAAQRVKMRREIGAHTMEFKDLRETREYGIAVKMVEKLETLFSKSFAEEESVYITLHLLGAKIQAGSRLETMQRFDSLFADLDEHVTSLIKLVGDILEMDFQNDLHLRQSLMLHLRPTLVRLKYGLALRNPLLDRIKEEYTSYFAAAWATNALFERRYGFSINEDEVAYLTMHIAGAVGRLEKQFSALVVCASGIGTSELVAVRLKRVFPSFKRVEVVPYAKLTPGLIETFNLVITTIALRDYPEAIYVTPMFDLNDQRKVRLKMDEADPRENEENKLFSNIFDRQYMYVVERAESFRHLLSTYSRILIENGVADEGFTESVLNREKVGTTIIGNGISIPHGNQDYVNQSKIVTIKLLEPIVYRDTEVDLVLLFALKLEDKEQSEAFFSTLYRFLDDQSWLAQKHAVKSKEDLVRLFHNDI